MAYAALISLKQTINGLGNSSPTSLLEILEFAYNQTTSLQQVLETLNTSISRSNREILDAFDDQFSHTVEDALEKLISSISRSSRERLDALERQIRDCAHKLEDVLEFHELNSYEDEELRQEIASFVETAKKMEKYYTEELSRPLTEEKDDNDDAIVSSTIDSDVEMVGNSRLFNSIRDRLLHRMRPDDKYIFSFFGEVGSGRTMVAKTIFEDLRQIFDCCAWVTIGTEFQLREVLISIIVQVYNVDGYLFRLILQYCVQDEKLCKYLYKILEDKKYMIVLDDVHNEQLVHYLSRSLPDQSNGSLFILTTSLKEVAQLGHGLENFEMANSRYIQEIFWSCIRKMIFGYESISPELDKAGKKIIENIAEGFVFYLPKLFST